MNYAIVAVGGLLLLTVGAWIFWGRTRFIGPVRTINAEMTGRIGRPAMEETRADEKGKSEE